MDSRTIARKVSEETGISASEVYRIYNSYFKRIYENLQHTYVRTCQVPNDVRYLPAYQVPFIGMFGY